MDIREIMRSNSSGQQFFLVNVQDLKNAIDASIRQAIQELIGKKVFYYQSDINNIRQHY